MFGMTKSSPKKAEYVVVCPGCASTDLTVLERGYELEVFVTDSPEFILTIGVCGCEKCGLIFLNPRMNQQQLSDYYSKQSRIPRNYVESDSPFSKLMEMQINEIKKFKPIVEGMSVLEIGCAEGFFLQSLGKRVDGNLKLYGIELSKQYIDYVKRFHPDVVLFEDPFEQTDLGDLKFDLVVVRHVLEHISSPMAFLAKIRSILSREGIVYIEVPDMNEVPFSISPLYHHEHLLYFTSRTLNNYLKSVGFETLTCRSFDGNPINSGFSYPVIRSVSKLGQQVTMESLPRYAKNLYLLNKRASSSAQETLIAPVRQRLGELVSAEARIGLFGGGPHSMDLIHLLNMESLPWCKIFDNNKNKQGKYMHGIPIEKPDENSLNSVDCILISSQEFEDEMVKNVRSLVGEDMEIIRIYGDDAPH